MTKKGTSARMQLVLFEEQPKPHRRTVDNIFEPLLRGKPVAIQVNDPKQPIKRRVKDAPMLMIMPSEVFGGSGKLIVSFQTHGCEILDIQTDLKSISFARLGLNMTLSRVLAQQLMHLYHGEH